MEQMTIKKLLSLKSGDWVTKIENGYFVEFQFIGFLNKEKISTFFFYSEDCEYFDLSIFETEIESIPNAICASNGLFIGRLNNDFFKKKRIEFLEKELKKLKEA